MKLRCKVEELMNRDDAVFCASLILPDSRRIECRLSESPCAKVKYACGMLGTQYQFLFFMQALYEAVFALSDVDWPFSVYTRVGHVLLDPNSASLSEIVQLSCVFVVEENDTGPDLFHLFSPPVILITGTS